MNHSLNKKIFFTILFGVLSIILVKIIISYYYYPSEDIFLKIVLDVKGSNYLPIIKSYSELNLSPTFQLEQLSEVKVLSVPYLSLFIHSILLKIFGPISIVLIEFFAITIFFLIFYFTLRKLDFNDYESLLVTILLFVLPIALVELSKFDINSINLIRDNFIFYDTRIPRPLISNLYFFLFILILIKLNSDKNFTLIRSILLGLSVGLSINSFTYFFFIEAFVYLFFIFLIKKSSFLKHFYDEKKFYFTFFILSIFFLSIFLYQISISSTDHSEIIGFFAVNLDQKLELLKYYFKFTVNKYVLLLFFLNLFLFIYLKNKIPNIIILYFVYLSSYLSFLFFILVINKGIHYYFFQNLVLTTGILFFIICFFKIIIKSIGKRILTNSVMLFVSLIAYIYFNFSYYNNYIKIDERRENLNEIVEIIKKENTDIKILLYDTAIFNALVLNNYNNFLVVPNSFWTARPTKNVENDLFYLFKIYNLNEDDLLLFLKNNITQDRIINSNTVNFFGLKYFANKIYTYKGFDNFTDEEKRIISKTSPFFTQQTVIPINEYERMVDKFNKINLMIEYPKIIVIDKSNKIFNNHAIDEKIFCLYHSNNTFNLYKKIQFCE